MNQKLKNECWVNCTLYIIYIQIYSLKTFNIIKLIVFKKLLNIIKVNLIYDHVMLVCSQFIMTQQ